ncbi:MAG: hypothetical protein CM15mP77_2240 [Synechococcus sp.]|nr:MAG: hypothetical protein CM15mP77_2240 [Synechococcus sp.]
MRFSAQVLLELREFKPDGMLRFLMLKGISDALRGPGKSGPCPMAHRCSTN